MNRIKQMERVQKEGLELFTKKNRDYGDSFANYGPIGVIVRMGDKINRLTTITNSGITMVETESIRDTLMDLHNYAAMVIMLMDEKSTKPDKEESTRQSDKEESTTQPDKEESTTSKTITVGLPKNDSVGHELYLEDQLNNNMF